MYIFRSRARVLECASALALFIRVHLRPSAVKQSAVGCPAFTRSGTASPGNEPQFGVANPARDGLFIETDTSCSCIFFRSSARVLECASALALFIRVHLRPSAVKQSAVWCPAFTRSDPACQYTRPVGSLAAN